MMVEFIVNEVDVLPLFYGFSLRILLTPTGTLLGPCVVYELIVVVKRT